MAWTEAAASLSPASFWVPDDLCRSAWTEHAPFGFWLAEALRPRCLVELGTHNGYSFFAFCQAIERLRLGCTAYAVDTWKGDEHAGFYDEEVYRSVTQRSSRYGGFATLIRSTFDDALPYFPDLSIDLLHIDGRHSYEDVSHDYRTWAPKLSARAVVLFHDVNVRERGFGVWRFFDELAAEHPSFRFVHGHGLGVVAAGKAVPPEVMRLTEASLQTADLIRGAYSVLGASVRARQSLAERQGDIAALRDVLVKREAAAEVALGDMRAILGLGASRGAAVEQAAPIAKADPPAEADPNGSPKAASPRGRKSRLTAGESDARRRP